MPFLGRNSKMVCAMHKKYDMHMHKCYDKKRRKLQVEMVKCMFWGLQTTYEDENTRYLSNQHEKIHRIDTLYNVKRQS